MVPDVPPGIRPGAVFLFDQGEATAYNGSVTNPHPRFRMTKITHESSVGEALQHSSSGGYLGDPAVVGSLLRTYASRVLTTKYASDDAFAKDVDSGARALARVFLGQDPRFPGPPWFSPGQIDVYVGKWSGTDSADPEERVAGGVLDLVKELAVLGNAVSEHKMLEANWKWQADEVLGRYVKMMMGMPA